MAQQNINIGALGAGNGDTLRQAAIKIENNFTDLYPQFPHAIFPHTGSFFITGSSGYAATLGVTGSISLNSRGQNTPISSSQLVIRPDAGRSSGEENPSILSSSICQIPFQTFIAYRRDDALDTALQGYTSINFITSTTQLTNFDSNLALRFQKFKHPALPTFDTRESTLYRSVTIKNDAGGIAFQITSSASPRFRSIGINQAFPSTTEAVAVNGIVSASQFKYATDKGAFLNPGSDPGVATEFYVADAGDIFGDDKSLGQKVLCVSQGPKPLPRRGLVYMWASGLTGSHSNGVTTIFESPRPIVTPVFSTFQSAIRSKAGFTDGQNLGFVNEDYSTDSNYPGLKFQIYDTNASYSSMSISEDQGFPSDSARVSSSFVFWWKGVTDEPYTTPAAWRKFMGSSRAGGSSLALGRRDSIYGTDNLVVLQGTNAMVTMSNYFGSEGVDDWHMVALCFEGSSGANKTFKTFFKTNVSESFIDDNITISLWNTPTKNIFIGDDLGSGGGAKFSSSLFMYYTSSLTYNELIDTYNYFSGSHGLTP